MIPPKRISPVIGAAAAAMFARCGRVAPAVLGAGIVAGCATLTPPPSGAGIDATAVAWLNRVTWGADRSSLATLKQEGRESFLERQLHPGNVAPQPEIEARIASFEVSQRPLDQLLQSLEEERKSVAAAADGAQKGAAARSYQRHLSALARQAATRSLLRDLYSPTQLQEQMTWFWLNHFNVSQTKRNLRAMVGDFEDRAIRPYALGKFRDLLRMTMRHPAMLRYLDNERNASGHANENYARELLELHTLGVDGGYSQRDVQEVARVLTGLGVNATDKVPKLRPELVAQYVRDGAFEFNPRRHDYGDKEVLGQRIAGTGLAESDALIAILSASPATARFICGKLAVYFVSDDPPRALVDRLAAVFQRSDGDIAAVLATLFHSAEFNDSLGRKFKDPIHYTVSAVRLAHDGTIVDPAPMIGWLNRMGEPLYGRITPDGYSLTQVSWASSGQMATRFEIAQIIGNEAARRPGVAADATQSTRPAYDENVASMEVAVTTRDVLAQATSLQERNLLLLASPEFMRR